jgi:hypothetical protein
LTHLVKYFTVKYYVIKLFFSNKTMENLQNIYGIIKKSCDQTGIPDKKCYAELEWLAPANSLFFPFHFYLRIIRGLGLIKLTGRGRMIVLTEKGRAVDDFSQLNFRPFVLFVLHCTGRIFTVIVLLILFWPMHLSVQRRDDEKRNDESSACEV